MTARIEIRRQYPGKGGEILETADYSLSNIRTLGERLRCLRAAYARAQGYLAPYVDAYLVLPDGGWRCSADLLNAVDLGDMPPRDPRALRDAILRSEAVEQAEYRAAEEAYRGKDIDGIGA